jgi:menaquinone-dependent protoporphyrinogen IX oxidase
MPKKPLHPTIYPAPTRADTIQSFAKIIAAAAVRMSQYEENASSFEPEIKQETVNKETSVKPLKTEVQFRMDFGNEP